MTDFPPGFRGRDRYGEYEVLAIDGDYRLVRYDGGREERRSLATLRLAHRNREYDHSRPPPAAPVPTKSRAVARPAPRPRHQEASFSLEETLPVIADVIRRQAGNPATWVTHPLIVAGLLDDPRGRRLIARARELQGDDRKPEAIAANMVAWFSQQYTTGALPQAQRFKRKKIDGAWAYRPEEGARD